MFVGVWLGGGPAGEGSARLSLSLSLCLAAAWRAAHTSATFACAKKPCVEVPRRLSPPSACVVDQPAICLSAYESSSSTATVCPSGLICCFDM